MKSDFVVFKQYYQDVAKRIPDDSPFIKDIEHKFRHSVEVLHVGQKILENTPELNGCSRDFKDYAEKALLFHDVGRFKEALYRYRADKKHVKITAAGCEHGLIGYNLMKKNDAYNDIRILFSLRYHGKMMENVRHSLLWKKIQKSTQRDDIVRILYLVRDADKLANLEHIKKDNHLTKDVFYRQLSKEALNAPISDIVKEQFLAKKTILFPTVYSFADRVLMVLSWIFDLNYQYTKKTFKRSSYDKYLLQELNIYHPNKEDLGEIEKLTRQTLRARN